MLIYGKNSIKEALSSNKDFEKIFIQKDLKGGENESIISKIKELNVPYTFLDKKIMDKKVGDVKHQGFIAEIAEFKYSDVEDIISTAKSEGKQIFLCLLDGIEDPHNLGSIIRSCECAGVQGVIMEKRNCCDVNATVMKVSAGAINHIKIAKVTNLVQTIDMLKKQGVWVYSIELGGENIYKSNLKGDIAIVIGSEGFGTRKLVKEKSDGVLTFPMQGKVNSLNASNACAIALFEILRQRLN